jgi:eukaryotic-like serine/threonine-protein kinase
MSIPPPGTTIDRYSVETPIGSGSMGDVVRGVDVDLKRAVAIKILSEKHRDNDELRARFLREGRAAAAIGHPNVVQVFTTGTFDGRPYIAMELLRGVDLGTVVNEHGVMGSLTAARAALDTARGLDAAARAGLIHRDVKPSNLVLTDTGLVKVTDFGLAKPIDPGAEPALTALGVVVGTPDYIAPEQARGETIDERVDIYALGGTLYFLLTGAPPYRTGNPADDKYLKVVARHLKDPVPDPRARNPAADFELAALGRRMMSKKPGDRPRYPELLDQLTAIVERLQKAGGEAPAPKVSSKPVTPEPTPFLGGPGRLGRAATEPAAPPGAPARPAAAAAAPPASSVGQLPPGPPNRWLVAITALSVLVFAAGLLVYLFGPREAPPTVARAIDAGVADAAPPPRPPLVTPDGMMLVARPDGTPWFFIDVAPVSHGAFAAAYPALKKPQRQKKKNALPVVEVSYAEAEAHGESLGKRLPKDDEWAAAETVIGWTSAGELWEWVDDGSRGAQARRAIRAAGGKQDRRVPRGYPNVTYRLVQDLPP